MIPLKLTIEGLYSYQERQTIDFEELTAAGLFGIFGAVGSGKSSILEAISFALYGETERLNSRDKRSYNMMNLKSNRSYIEFEFLNHENEKYKTVREYRRNSKKFEDVNPVNSNFYKETDGIWMPVENSDAEEILGLSYNNFKRTIIIPQGQFKEFLELGATDRTTMMKEIFNLHRFDLADKTKRLYVDNKSELDVLEGKLSGFEEVNDEILKELKSKFEEEKEKREKLKLKHEKAVEEFRKLKEKREGFQLFQSNLEKLKEFEEREEEIQNQTRQLERFEKTRLQFQQIIKTEHDLKIEIKSKTDELNQKQSEYNQLKIDLNTTHNKLEGLKPKFDNLEIQKQRSIDLETIVELKDLNLKINNIKGRVENGKSFVEKKKENLKEKENQIERAEEELKEFKKQKTDSEILIAAESWYQKNAAFNEQFKNKESSILDFDKKLDDLTKELKNWKVNPDNFEDEFNEKIIELETQKQKLISHENHLKLEQKLNEYAHTLHDGEPCPLCGSHEHPNVLSGKDLSEEINQLNSKKEKIETEIKEVNQLKNKVEKNLDTQKIYSDQITKEKDEFDEIKAKQNELKKSFVWKEFDADNPEKFEEFKKKSLEIEKQIDEKQNAVNQLAIDLKKIKENLDKYNSGLKNLEIEESQFATEFKTKGSGLKTFKFSDFENITVEEISKQAKDLKTEIQNIENDYQNTDKKLNELNIKESGLKSTLDSLEKSVKELNDKSLKITDEINQKLKAEDFESKEVMLSVLNLSIKPEEVRKEIHEFKVGFETLKNKINEQNEKLKDFESNDEVFEIEKQKLEELTKEFNENVDKTSKLEGELNRLKKAFDEKKDLLKNQEKLKKREENLKILSGLFKGQGFVNYISGIYLRQLCDHANTRFHRMTRNQLSLQLNENLDFEIIDYLNEGRSRSVKTLSGGQSFQVSLSLALALAESVQTQSKSDKNFFFIDEGFGTQDSEAVNIVFDTLMQLQKENRIVGIISHVSELKDRIPVSLQIEKDEEKGSLIYKN